MQEPKRIKDPNKLWQPFRVKVDLLVEWLKEEGEDPLIYETFRTNDRQKYLYAIGRTIQKNRKPVTYTMKSRHLVGKAVDIISRKNLWNDPMFFLKLKQGAKRFGLRVLSFEQCHVEWIG